MDTAFTLFQEFFKHPFVFKALTWAAPASLGPDPKANSREKGLLLDFRINWENRLDITKALTLISSRACSLKEAVKLVPEPEARAFKNTLESGRGITATGWEMGIFARVVEGVPAGLGAPMNACFSLKAIDEGAANAPLVSNWEQDLKRCFHDLSVILEQVRLPLAGFLLRQLVIFIILLDKEVQPHPRPCSDDATSQERSSSSC